MRGGGSSQDTNPLLKECSPGHKHVLMNVSRRLSLAVTSRKCRGWCVKKRNGRNPLTARAGGEAGRARKQDDHGLMS